MADEATKPAPQTAPEAAAEKPNFLLDKFKLALGALKGVIGQQELSKEKVEATPDVRGAFEKDMDELNIPKEKHAELWQKALEALNASAEKQNLDAFVTNVENFDVIKQAIEASGEGEENIVKKLWGELEKKWNESKWGKQLKWSVISAFIGDILITTAQNNLKAIEKAKAEGKSGGFLQKIFYEKMLAFGEYALPEEEKKKRKEAMQATAQKEAEAKGTETMENLKALAGTWNLDTDSVNADMGKLKLAGFTDVQIDGWAKKAQGQESTVEKIREALKKKLNLTTAFPVSVYDLRFEGMEDAKRDALLKSFESISASFDPKKIREKLDNINITSPDAELEKISFTA